jgi:biopolymer transport protein ExbD
MSSPSFRRAAITGIDVPPLVDVMLVLLIIFMRVTPGSVQIITDRPE